MDPEGIAPEGLARFGVGGVEVLDGLRTSIAKGGNETLAVGEGSEGATRKIGDVGAVQVLSRRRSEDGKFQVGLSNEEYLRVVSADENPGVLDLPGCAGVLLELGELDFAVRVEAWRNILSADDMLVVSGGVMEPEDVVGLARI